ncbi:MAG TPA: S-layer homology domain-containing protein, partial [Clostridiales bacterium]|nr:S-layer homology domain-containing protein [Clostridiales bacterium]
WLRQLLEVANVLDGYEGYPGADLYKNPKFMKMFSAFYPLILAERYTAQIGDSGGTGNPGLMVSISESVKGFEKFGDPVLAQLAYFLNNNSAGGLHGDIFTQDPESIGPAIENVIAEKGKLDLGSTNLAGYGFSVLRDGKNNKQYFGIQIPFANLSAFDATIGFKHFASNGTIQFESDKIGDKISFRFNVEKTDIYEVDLNPFRAGSYGIYDISIDGTKVKTLDFYGGSGADSNLEPVATLELTAGEHVITFEGVDKNENATGYKMGVIHIVLFDNESLKVKNDTTLLNTLRDFWMYYGRTNTSHAHRDQLNLGVHAFGLDISPDLGYPEETGDQPNRVEWVSNTVSHNTVVVDKTKQNDYYGGAPIHFDDSDTVDVMDVDSTGAYSQTQMYRRTVAMVKVDDEISYGVDFFRVKGGSDHYYSFHGAEGAVATEGLNLIGQKDPEGNFVGTYAGVNTQFGVRPSDDSVAGWSYKGAGFHWLKNVEKDSAPGNNFSIDWDVVDGRKVLPQEMDIHLRLTMLGKYDDVAIMDGVPPKKPGNPASLKYMIAHRSGQNLSSTFTAVIEPYKDARYIESICEVPVTVNGEAAAGDVKAVKVVLKNGRTDYIVNSLDKETVYTVDGKFQFKGFLGVYSEKEGQQVYGYVNDGTIIGTFNYDLPATVAGTVKSFTKEMSVNNELTVELADIVDLNEITGRYIYITNDGVQNAAYKVNGIKSVNGNEVTLDLGASTLIRSYVNSSDISQGFNYNIAEGNSFVIPMSLEKSKPPVDPGSGSGSDSDSDSDTTPPPVPPTDINPKPGTGNQSSQLLIQINQKLDDGLKNIGTTEPGKAISTLDEIIKQAGQLKADEKNSISEKLGLLVDETLGQISSIDIHKVMGEDSNVIITENKDVLKVEIEDQAITKAIDDLCKNYESIKSLLTENGFDKAANTTLQKGKELKVISGESSKEIDLILTVKSIDALSSNGIDLLVDSKLSLKLPAGAVDLKYTLKYMEDIGQDTKDTEKIKDSKILIVVKELDETDGDVYSVATREMIKENTGISDASQKFELYLKLLSADGSEKTGIYIEKFNKKLLVKLPLDDSKINNSKINIKSNKLGVYWYNPDKKVWSYVGGKIDTDGKKILFTTDHLSVYAAFEYVKTFNDIQTNWAKDYIEVLASRQIVNGVNNYIFQPNRNVTRAEFTKMLIEALGLVDTSAKAAFADVEEDAWYYKYVSSAQKLGIVNGTAGNMFKPEEIINRQDMAVMAYRSVKAAGLDLLKVKDYKEFKDNKNISSYAKDSVMTLQQAGIIEGSGNSMFMPKNNSARAEAAKIIYMLIEGLQ